MAGFHVTRIDGGEAARLAAARAQFARHGFAAPTEFRTATHAGFHVRYILGGAETFVRRGEDFVAAAGVLAYRGRIGAEALTLLLDAFAGPFDDWESIDGQFALIVHKGGRTWALTDYFGAFQLFHDADFRTLSTSFLATALSLPKLTLAPQGVYEFAFNVFPTGDDTILDQVRRVGPNLQLELGAGTVRHVVAKPLPERTRAMPLADRIAAQAERLREVVAPYVAAYGDRIQCPLSGGIDSRLALALLRDAGVRPHVYVYGASDSEDVTIARAVGAAEGFTVETFDKRAWTRIEPDAFADQVETSFQQCDALITDGELFDNGGNAFARHARHAGGQLAVSGGCGEVFRNFFYLPNRRFRAGDAIRAFFARFTPADTTALFDPQRFVAAIEAKALACLGRSDPAEPLPRIVIEQLYPRLRCRAFFGREISVLARQGAYLMPFFERRVIEQAITTPMDLKRYGRFEAALLTHIDPRLASYPSAYGHAFDAEPTTRHRVSEIGSSLRPTWARARSYALQRRMGPMRDEHGGLLSPIFLGRVIDLHFPHMRRFFRIDNVADTGLYRRIATLEYVAQHFEDRLVDR